jgi:hypothetical protein
MVRWVVRNAGMDGVKPPLLSLTNLQPPGCKQSMLLLFSLFYTFRALWKYLSNT